MHTLTFLLAVAILGATLLVQGAALRWDFSDQVEGQPPEGFEFGHTAEQGRPGRWVIRADGGDKVLAQVDDDPTRARVPLAVLAEVEAVDVDLSVRFRPLSGRVDQAGGLVWRFRDQDNYYIVRANVLEHNVVLYKVENGKRTDLPLLGEGRTYGKKVQVPSGKWSTLRVVAVGPRFEVYFNGAKLYTVEDRTFSLAGKVGVWTKADSVTEFDDLNLVVQ
jgi:hypothetical protein